MAFFNRRKSQTISDLENYYANRNNSTSRAWLMALLSLIVTVAVLAVLFFSIRWVYRTLTNDDTTVVTTTTQTDTSNDTAIEIVDPSLTPSAQGATTTTPPSEPEGVVSSQAATTTTPRSTTQTNATAQGANTTALPNTGAGENALIILLSTVVIGYFVARYRYAHSR